MIVKDLITKLQRENPEAQAFVRIEYTNDFYPIDDLSYWLSEPKVFLITGPKEKGDMREIPTSS